MKVKSDHRSKFSNLSPDFFKISFVTEQSSAVSNSIDYFGVLLLSMHTVSWLLLTTRKAYKPIFVKVLKFLLNSFLFFKHVPVQLWLFLKTTTFSLAFEVLITIIGTLALQLIKTDPQKRHFFYHGVIVSNIDIIYTLDKIMDTNLNNWEKWRT